MARAARREAARAGGDHVEAGQLIGRVGDSGNAEDTTPHTHFELKRGTEKVNAYPYLVRAWRARDEMPTKALWQFRRPAR